MPNEEQLKEIAEEVSYEWEMLLWAFGPLCREMGVETASPILTEMCFYGTTVDNCIVLPCWKCSCSTFGTSGISCMRRIAREMTMC